MQKQIFSIDFLDGQTFEGYTNGEDWNGFACPYFTYEQAQRLVEAWRGRGWQARYNSESDRFTFEMQSGETEESLDCFSPVEVDGMKFYPIGAHCWIWEEVSQEDVA